MAALVILGNSKKIMYVYIQVKNPVNLNEKGRGPGVCQEMRLGWGGVSGN